jgi:hypothetical protein
MEQTTEQLFADVRARLQSHDGQGAIDLIWPYISEHHDDATGRSLYGMALFTAGHTDAGIEELRRAATLQPDMAPLHFNLAVALYQSGDRTAAQGELEQTLLLDPTHTSATTMLDRLKNVPAAAAAPVVTSPAAPPLVTSPSSALAESTRFQPLTGANIGVPQGMAFTPATVVPSSVSARALKGLGWGAAYGQYWTIWSVVWLAIDSGGHASTMDLVAISILYAIACSIVGGLVGLVVFTKRGNRVLGQTAGVVGGMVLLGLEFLLYRDDPKILVNIIFWYLTGRFVGRMIGNSSKRKD